MASTSTSGICIHQPGVTVEVERPAAVPVDAFGHRLPSVAVMVQVSVLELDPGARVALGDEPNSPLAAAGAVRLELPPRSDVPAEHETARRLVGQDACPPTFAPVNPPVHDVPADPRFEDRLGDGDG